MRRLTDGKRLKRTLAAGMIFGVTGLYGQNVLFDDARTERALTLSGSGLAGAPAWDGITRNPAGAAADTLSQNGVALNVRRHPDRPTIWGFSAPFFFRNRAGLWGGGADYTRVSAARYADSTGLTPGGFNAAEIAVFAAYARKIGTRWSAGATLGYVYSTFVGLVAGQRQRGPGHTARGGLYGQCNLLDVGEKRRFRLTAAAALTEIGPPLRYFHPERKTPLPTALTLAWAAAFLTPTTALTLYADPRLRFRGKDVFEAAAGLELSLKQRLFFRAGVRTTAGKWTFSVGTAARIMDVAEIGFGFDGGYFAALGVFWRK